MSLSGIPYTSQSSLYELFGQMSISPYVFQLTGSRFFNSNDSEESDWDFFVEDTFGLCSWLLAHNFKRQTSESKFLNLSSYHDPSIAYCYRHPLDVDIQIIYSEYMFAKQSAQKYILKNWDSFNRFGKYHLSNVWQTAIQNYMTEEPFEAFPPTVLEEDFPEIYSESFETVTVDKKQLAEGLQKLASMTQQLIKDIWNLKKSL